MAPPLGPLPGTLELIVLKTLGAGSEMHGFAILEWILHSTDEEILVEDGALYHALHRMEGRGWVESDWGISEKGRRAKYYRISGAGKAALEEEGSRWSRYVAAVEKVEPCEAPE